jgi:hypothetical protein
VSLLLSRPAWDPRQAGGGQGVHQPTPGKSGPMTWHHGHVQKRRKVQPLYGAQADMPEEEGPEAAPGGHSPTSSAMCMPDSRCSLWFKAAVHT